jgi:hypothetical protein
MSAVTESNAQDLEQSVLESVFAVGANLTAARHVRRELRMVQVVPYQFGQLRGRFEFHDLAADVEVFAKHRDGADELESAAAGDFKRAAVEPVDFAIVQGVQAYFCSRYGARLIIREHFSANVLIVQAR